MMRSKLSSEMACSSGSGISLESLSRSNGYDSALSPTGLSHYSSKLSNSSVISSSFTHTSVGDTTLCPVTVMTPSLINIPARKNFLSDDQHDVTSNVCGNNNSLLVNRNTGTPFAGFNDSQATSSGHDDLCLGTSITTTAASVLNNDVNLQEGINEIVIQPLDTSSEMLIIDENASQEFHLTEFEIGVSDDHTQPTEIIIQETHEPAEVVIQETDDEILTRNPTISFMLNNRPIREIVNTLENCDEEDRPKKTEPSNTHKQMNGNSLHSVMLTDPSTNKNTSILKQRSRTDFELETKSRGLNDFKTCLCTDLETREEVPEDQMFIVQGQMYRLEGAVVVRVGHLQMHAFARDKSLYVPKCLLFHVLDGQSERLFRNSIRKKSVMDKMHTQNMLENDCELIRQKYNINTNCSSRLMFDLISLRKIARMQIEVPAGVHVLANEDYMVKVKTANTRCSACGSRIFNATVKDEFSVIDMSTLEANSDEGITNYFTVNVSIGVLSIHKTRLPSFKMKNVTYICLRDLVALNILSLHYLKTKLTELEYIPICAPPEVISNLKELHGVDYNSLWIDTNIVIKLCELYDGDSKHFLLQKFRDKCLCFQTRSEIFARDPMESEAKFVISDQTCLIVEKADCNFACEDSFFIGKKKGNQSESSKSSLDNLESHEVKCEEENKINSRKKEDKIISRKKQDKNISRKKENKVISRKKPKLLNLKPGCEYIVRDIEMLKSAVSKGFVYSLQNGFETMVKFSEKLDQASELKTNENQEGLQVVYTTEREPIVNKQTSNKTLNQNHDIDESLDHTRVNTSFSNQGNNVCLNQTAQETAIHVKAGTEGLNLTTDIANTGLQSAVPIEYDETMVEASYNHQNITPEKRNVGQQKITRYLNTSHRKTNAVHENVPSFHDQTLEKTSLTNQDNFVSLKKTTEERDTNIQDSAKLVCQMKENRNEGKPVTKKCTDEKGTSVHQNETKYRNKVSQGSKNIDNRSSTGNKKSKSVASEEYHTIVCAENNSKDICSEKTDISLDKIQEKSQPQENKISANVTQNDEGKQDQTESRETNVLVDNGSELFHSPIQAPKKSTKLQSPKVQDQDSIDKTITPVQLHNESDKLQSPTKLAFSIDKILSPVQTHGNTNQLLSASKSPLCNQHKTVSESPLHSPEKDIIPSAYHSLSSKAKINKIANKINSRIAPMMNQDSNTEPETNLNMLASAALATADDSLESENEGLDDAQESADNQMSVLQQSKSEDRKKEIEMKIKQFVEFRLRNGIIEVTRFLPGAETAFPELFRPYPNHPEALKRQKLFKLKVSQWVMGFVSKKRQVTKKTPNKKTNTQREIEVSKCEKEAKTESPSNTGNLEQSKERNNSCHETTDPLESTSNSVNNELNQEKRKTQSESPMNITQTDFKSNQKKRKLDSLLNNSVQKNKKSNSKKRKIEEAISLNKLQSDGEYGPESMQLESDLVNDESIQRNKSGKKKKLDHVTVSHENKRDHVHESETVNNVMTSGDSCPVDVSDASVNCYEFHEENEDNYVKNFDVENVSIKGGVLMNEGIAKKVKSHKVQSQDINNLKHCRKENMNGSKSQLKNCKSLFSQKLCNKKENERTNRKGSIKVCLKQGSEKQKKKQLKQSAEVQLEMERTETNLVQNERLQTSPITETAIDKCLTKSIQSRSVDPSQCQTESSNKLINQEVANGMDQETDFNGKPKRRKKTLSKTKQKNAVSEKTVKMLEESSGVAEDSLTDNSVSKSRLSGINKFDVGWMSPSGDNAIWPLRGYVISSPRKNVISPSGDNLVMPLRDNHILPLRDNHILPLSVQRKEIRSDTKVNDIERFDKTDKDSVLDKGTSISLHNPDQSPSSNKAVLDKDTERMLKWKALHEPSFVVVKKLPF